MARILDRIPQDFERVEGDQTTVVIRRRFDEVPSTRPMKERLSLERRMEMVVHHHGSLVEAVREAGREEGPEAVVNGQGCGVQYWPGRE